MSEFRYPGLYVILRRAPGPESDFVELEDQEGKSVGPTDSGARWTLIDGGLWRLGPFRSVYERPVPTPIAEALFGKPQRHLSWAEAATTIAFLAFVLGLIWVLHG